MKNYQKDLMDWVKVHKKQLIIGGISVTVIMGIILGLKNKDAVIGVWAQLEKSIKNPHDTIATEAMTVQAATSKLDKVVSPRPYTTPQEAFDVRQHVRTLSGGRQHSAKKAAEAEKLGIVLLTNQTLVDSYTKGVA